MPITIPNSTSHYLGIELAVKIAFFVMLHHKAYQFEWLMNAIYNSNDIFIIHVDLKSLLDFKGRGGTYTRVRDLVRGKRNIVLMIPRTTNWGGWSLSAVALRAISLALSRDKEWSYFVNVSGDCYPVKPLSHLRDCLTEKSGRVYVETKHFSLLPEEDWHKKRGRVIETPVKIVELPGRRQPPKTFTLDSKGSQWVMLPRAFCEWQHSSIIRRDIARYLRFSPLSDETIFQTLLLNGPFRDQQAPHYGRTIKLVEPDPHPSLLTMADLPFIDSDSGFIGRKFDAKIDSEILGRLADRIGAAVGPSATRSH